MRRLALFSLILVFGKVSMAQENPAVLPFTIEIVDAETARGVPLVELRTVHEVSYFSDSAGFVTVADPELEGREVYFHVSSHGYESKADGFGFRGVRLRVKRGEAAKVELQRLSIAERLYRITGSGIYDHSIEAARPVPVQEPLLNARVFGSDSVHTAVWKGKLFWLWGDTNRPDYPLGNFQVAAALSDLPGAGGLDPEVGVNLRYFKSDTGFAAEVGRMPGEGPTWISGLTVLPDEKGTSHLVGHFVKVRGMLDIYRRGLCEWDDEAAAFREVLVFPESQQITPDGHPFRVTEEEKEFLIFADPLPRLKIPATYEAWKNPESYEALPAQENFHDVMTGRRVEPHRGTITWNDHQNRWVMIFTETGGEASFLGEVWYAESEDYAGPWEKCVQIVTHDRYSFYNPKQHPEFSGEGGRYLYFEGTYTALFSGNERKTPKYDYNQIMYRLDLDDERLLPAGAR